MGERRKNTRRSQRKGSAVVRTKAPGVTVDAPPPALERRVVDLLEVLHVLAFNADLALAAARADAREPARSLAEPLEWLKQAGGNGSEVVQALNAFLQAVSAAHLLEEKEDAHG